MRSVQSFGYKFQESLCRVSVGIKSLHISADLNTKQMKVITAMLYETDITATSTEAENIYAEKLQLERKTYKNS